MAVSSTGYLNPTSATVIRWNVSNINNILNSNETYAEAIYSSMNFPEVRVNYNLIQVNKFSKARMNIRVRGRVSSEEGGYVAHPNGHFSLTQSLTNYNYSSSTMISSQIRDIYQQFVFDLFNARLYYYQLNMEYVLGNIGVFTELQKPKGVGIRTDFDIKLSCDYSIYNSDEEVAFNYSLPDEYIIKNIDFSENNSSIFQYITHDSDNKQIKFKLTSAFVNSYMNNITNEYTNQFKMNITLRTSDVNDNPVNNLTITQLDFNIVSNIKLPNVIEGFIYKGTKTQIKNISKYILFEDTDIMPTTEEQVYIDNLDLMAFTKSRLHDIPTNSHDNELSTNYGANKGIVQGLLLDSNTFSLKLLSKISDYNELIDVVSEIFMNFQSNIRLKLGLLPNKIISCRLKGIDPEPHSTYSYINLEFEKLQRTPYNHYTLKNIQNNQFVVNNYQREPAVITINGSGSTLNLSITDQNGTQSMTINHSFNNEVLIDSKANKVYIDKLEIDLNALTYDSEFFELRGKCNATLNNGNISKVVI